MLEVLKSSAGAGKTYRLALRYIVLLFEAYHSHSQHSHRPILAVTFTKKATGEMKQRIVQELAALASSAESKYRKDLMAQFGLTAEQIDAEARTILFDLLQDYSAFNVNTIDSFFQQVVRAFAREMHLNGSYSLELDEVQIRHAAVDDLFYNIDAGSNGNSLIDDLWSIIQDNIESDKSWNPKQTVLDLSKELYKETFIQNKAKIIEWTESEAFDKLRNELKKLQSDYFKDVDEIKKEYTTKLAGRDDGQFANGKNRVSVMYWSHTKLLAELKKSEGKVAAFLMAFAEDPANALTKKNQNNPELVQLAADVYPAVVKMSKMLSVARVKPLLTAMSILKHLSYLRVLVEVSQRISAQNEELNRLPIADTNRLIYSIVRENSDTPFIYDKIGVRLRHYMIDEFQDTSSMQWHNFRPLIAESLAHGSDNLLVGDVKQSIYRWRNSDYSLLESGVKHDFPNSYSEEVMLSNWRSSHTIVNCNNAVLKSLSDSAENFFVGELGGTNADLKGRISAIYSDLAQKPEKDKAGYVNYKFIEAQKKEGFQQAALEVLVERIHNVADRGLKLGNIAVLVRTNVEGQLVAERLLKEGIAVMSAEALRITSIPETRIIVNLIGLSVMPDDGVRKTLLESDCIKLGVATITHYPELSDSRSMYEQVETIVRTYQLDQREEAVPYLNALLDRIFVYQGKYKNDWVSFLKWWDEKGHKLNIPAGTDTDAVQVMTIHKSKGLEFEVVMIPFVDWRLALPKTSPIVWANLPAEAFNPNQDLPPLPITIDKSLKQTELSIFYFEELQRCIIDNLNMTYVALTRAKREMYLVVEEVDKVGIEINSHFTALLKDKLNEKKEYVEGEPIDFAAEEKEKQTDNVQIEQFKLEILRGQRTEPKKTKTEVSVPFTQDTDTEATSRRRVGLIMHDLLCRIHYEEDVNQVLVGALSEGRFSEKEKTIIEIEIRKFLDMVRDRDWFDKRYEVINEQNILSKDANLRRPDRVLIDRKENTAVVIDYKFGLLQTEDNLDQLREYKSLLEDMGFATTAYLCYVNLKKICEV